MDMITLAKLCARKIKVDHIIESCRKQHASIHERLMAVVECNEGHMREAVDPNTDMVDLLRRIELNQADHAGIEADQRQLDAALAQASAEMSQLLKDLSEPASDSNPACH